MQIIQRFDDWLAEGETSDLTQDQIDFLDKYTQGKWTRNEGTGLVDIDGDFDCSSRGLKNLQDIRFGEVGGDFYCSGNELTTLVGAPQTVGGNFYCSGNELTTLVGAPQTVGGGFNCHDNRLTTLEGAPQTVGGGFNCHDNRLTTLEGAPQTVGGGFNCHYNQLTTLVGAPQTVGGGFNCYDNRLTTLEGAPQTVGGGFNCHYNQLTTLVGAPQTIEGEITLGGTYYQPDIKMGRGDWNLAGWLEILTKGTPEARDLIRTLPQLDPAVLQQEIDRNPEGMLVKLKDFLKHPLFQGLKWPDRLEQEKGLLLDLGDIGL